MEEIILNGKKYEFVEKVIYKNKTYVVYMDDDNVYIKEFLMRDNVPLFIDIPDNVFEEVKKECTYDL